jgi:putative ABC transport system permease protein
MGSFVQDLRNASDALKEGARGTSGARQRARSVLVAVEVAVAMLLLIGAGLTLRSFARLSAVDLGFNAADLITSNVILPEARYTDEKKIVAFYRELKEKVRALPGVTSVAMGLSMPYSQANISLRWSEIGAPPPEPGHEPVAAFRSVNADYARAFEIPVRRGRFFTEAEDRPDGAAVVVVNESFVRRYFGGADILGKRLDIGYKKDAPPAEVIGVIGDARIFARDREPEPEMLVPFSRAPMMAFIEVTARTTATAGFGAALQHAVESIDADQPLDTLKPMVQLVGASIDKQRLSTLLLGIFGAVALALALVGVYGVMSYTVTQRVREIGVRMALGARPRDVTRMVIRQGLLLAAAGVAAGIVAALALGGTMASLLYGVSATDPATFAAMALVLLAVTTLATWIPARRAARVDPMVALRSE